MCFYHLDTPAYAKLFKVLGANGLMCAMCRSKGYRLPGKTVYPYHRDFLGRDNHMRQYGIMKTCCANVGVLDPKTHESRCQCDQQLMNQIMNPHTANKTSSYFTNRITEKEFSRLSAYIKYPYLGCCVERYTTVSNTQYMIDGMHAAQKNAERKAKRDPNIVYKGKQKEITINGVRGTTKFAVMQKFDFQNHCNPDSFHNIMNVGKHCLEFWEGERAYSTTTTTPLLTAPVVEAATTNTSSSSSSSKTKKTTKKTKKGDPSSDNMWFISEESRQKVNTWINCLVIPAGYSRDFQVRHLFGDNAKLRGTAIHDVLSNLVDYILSADSGYSEDYRMFFHLFSLCISDLLCTKICKREYEEICGRMVEILCYYENMLPSSEVITCFHQLIHVVHYIRRGGPVRHFSTLGNERALGIIKRFMPNGGANMEFIVFMRYLNYEASCMDDAYDFEFTEEGIVKSSIVSKVNYSIKQCVDEVDGHEKDVLCFTDELFEMQNPSTGYTTIQLTGEETSELFEAIKCSVELRTVDYKDALQKSFIFRILACYEHRFHDKEELDEHLNLKNITFEQWLQYLITHLEEGYFKIGLYIIEKDPATDEEIFEEIVTRHGVYRRDTENIMLLQDTNWIVSLFDSALIFGTKFNCRGFNKRESRIDARRRYGVEGKKSETIFHVPTNDYNKLPNNWHYTYDNSSWCKYRVYNKDEEVYRYCQINSFIQISMPFDSFVDGTCFASITSRKASLVGYVDYVIADNEDGSLSDTLFIPAISIYSSPVLIGGFASEWALKNQNGKESKELRLTNMLRDGKPIYIGGNMQEDIKYKHLIANPRATSGIYSCLNHLSYLVLIEMKRERRNIKYDVERDVEYLYDFNNTGNTRSKFRLTYSFQFLPAKH